MPESSKSKKIIENNFNSTLYYYLIFISIYKFRDLLIKLYSIYFKLSEIDDSLFNNLLNTLSNYDISFNYNNDILKEKLREFFDRIKKLQPSIDESPIKKNPPNNQTPPSIFLKDERLQPHKSEITTILINKLVEISMLIIINKDFNNNDLKKFARLICGKLVEK